MIVGSGGGAGQDPDECESVSLQTLAKPLQLDDKWI